MYETSLRMEMQLEDFVEQVIKYVNIVGVVLTGALSYIRVLVGVA